MEGWGCIDGWMDDWGMDGWMDGKARQGSGEMHLWVNEQDAEPHPVMFPLHTTVSLWDIVGFSGRSGMGYSWALKTPTKTTRRSKTATKSNWTNLIWPKTLKSVSAHNCVIHKGIDFPWKWDFPFPRVVVLNFQLLLLQMSCCPSHAWLSPLKSRNPGTESRSPCPAPKGGAVPAPRGGAQKPGDAGNGTGLCEAASGWGGQGKHTSGQI